MRAFRVVIDDIGIPNVQVGIIKAYLSNNIQNENTEVIWGSKIQGSYNWANVPLESSKRLACRCEALKYISNTSTLFLSGAIVPGDSLDTNCPAKYLHTSNFKSIGLLSFFLVNNESDESKRFDVFLSNEHEYENIFNFNNFTIEELPDNLSKSNLQFVEKIQERPWYNRYTVHYNIWYSWLKKAVEKNFVTEKHIKDDDNRKYVRPSLSLEYNKILTSDNTFIDYNIDVNFLYPEVRVENNHKINLFSESLRERLLYFENINQKKKSRKHSLITYVKRIARKFVNTILSISKKIIRKVIIITYKKIILNIYKKLITILSLIRRIIVKIKRIIIRILRKIISLPLIILSRMKRIISKIRKGLVNKLLLIRDVYIYYMNTSKVLLLRDFRTRFRRTILGIAWFFVPLITLATLAVLLGKEMGLYTQDNLNIYFVRMLSGLIFWQFIADAWSEPVRMCRRSRMLIRSVPFRHAAILTSGLMSAILMFIIKLPLLIGAMLYFDFPFNTELISILFLIIVICLIGTTLSCFSVPLSIGLLDVRNSLPLIQSFLLFATPIFYVMPDGGFLYYINIFNPFTYIILPIQNIAVGNSFDILNIMLLILISLVTTMIGLYYFRRKIKLAISYIGES